MPKQPGIACDPQRTHHALAGNRRNLPRVAVDTPVVVTHGGVENATNVRNVSGTGALLAPVPGIAVGEPVHVSIPDTEMSVPARAVHVTADGVGIGFDDISVGHIVSGWIQGVSN